MQEPNGESDGHGLLSAIHARSIVSAPSNASSGKTSSKSGASTASTTSSSRISITVTTISPLTTMASLLARTNVSMIESPVFLGMLNGLMLSGARPLIGFPSRSELSLNCPGVRWMPIVARSVCVARKYRPSVWTVRRRCPRKGEHGSYKGRRLCRTCPLILHLLFNKWHNDLDQRAGIRLALDDQPTAEQSHSLADTFDPKVAVFD